MMILSKHDSLSAFCDYQSCFKQHKEHICQIQSSIQKISKIANKVSLLIRISFQSSLCSLDGLNPLEVSLVHCLYRLSSTSVGVALPVNDVRGTILFNHVSDVVATHRCSYVVLAGEAVALDERREATGVLRCGGDLTVLGPVVHIWRDGCLDLRLKGLLEAESVIFSGCRSEFESHLEMMRPLLPLQLARLFL